MSVSLKSSAVSTLVTAAGLAGLVAFVLQPAPTFAALWLAAELRGLKHRGKRDFFAFEPDPFAAARLQKTYDEAADVIQTLSEIESGRISHPDPEAAAAGLFDRYRALRRRISAMREIPPRAMRRWSAARAAVSALRIGAVSIPLLSGAALLWLSSKSGAGDPYRVLSAVSAAWTVAVLPPLYWFTRRRIEHGLGDRELFLQRWRQDDDFLDFYLARTDRQEAAAEEQPATEPEPPAGTPAAPGRPKRPWFEVLGVAPDADDDTIHRAYRARIKEYHPDQVQKLGAEIKALAEIVTAEVNAAYEEAGRSR